MIKGRDGPLNRVFHVRVNAALFEKLEALQQRRPEISMASLVRHILWDSVVHEEKMK